MSFPLPDLEAKPVRWWQPWAVAGAVLFVVDVVGLAVAAVVL
ncbi:hypothetical protein [Microbacterium album]|nr:hypothetical protein [Microbacterium album]